LIKPSIIVALGVTAARSLIGKSVTISGARKRPMALADGTVLAVTVHPSSLLRIQDEDDKRSAYEGFVADLKAAKAILRKAKTRSSR
jgi:uracil-DNA glycosylase